MSDAKQFINQLPGQKITGLIAEQVFQYFDTNKDGALDRKELRQLLCDLATTGSASEAQLQKVYDFLDIDGDGVISRRDFTERGAQWLSVLFNSTSALVIVDVQNDFITGSLALKREAAGQDGEEVVAVINRVLDICGHLLKLVVYSLDWHPKNHISFVENVGKRRFGKDSLLKDAKKVKTGDTIVLETESYGPVEQILWPEHCVQQSVGAQLHAKLKVVQPHEKIYKGTDPDIDSYSAFWDNGKRRRTDLYEKLISSGACDVIVCGLATDVCVGSTANHAQEQGFRTALLEDASRGISRDGIARTKARIVANNGTVVVSPQLMQLLNKRHRPIEWIVAGVDCVTKLHGN